MLWIFPVLKKMTMDGGVVEKLLLFLEELFFYFEQFFLEIAHRDLRRSVQKKNIYLIHLPAKLEPLSIRGCKIGMYLPQQFLFAAIFSFVRWCNKQTADRKERGGQKSHPLRLFEKNLQIFFPYFSLMWYISIVLIVENSSIHYSFVKKFILHYYSSITPITLTTIKLCDDCFAVEMSWLFG